MLIRARRAVGDFLFAGFQFGAEVEHSNGWSFDVFGTTISKTVFLKPYEGETIPSNKAVLTVHFAGPESAVPVEATAVATATGQILATMGAEECKPFHLPLSVKFQPQQWINDDAVDSGPAFYFDAAPAILGMTADEVRALSVQVYKEHGRDMDILAERSDLLGAGRDRHDGPFHLELEATEFDIFLFAAGIDKGAILSDADIAAARASREPRPPALQAGDTVIMGIDAGAQIEVGHIHEAQPLAADGIFLFRDQYDDEKMAALDGNDWLVVMDHELTEAQRDLLQPSDGPSLDF